MNSSGSNRIKRVSIIVDLLIINSCFIFFSYLEFNKVFVHKDYFAFIFILISLNITWFFLSLKQQIHERGKGIEKIIECH